MERAGDRELELSLFSVLVPMSDLSYLRNDRLDLVNGLSRASLLPQNYDNDARRIVGKIVLIALLSALNIFTLPDDCRFRVLGQTYFNRGHDVLHWFCRCDDSLRTRPVTKTLQPLCFLVAKDL